MTNKIKISNIDQHILLFKLVSMHKMNILLTKNIIYRAPAVSSIKINNVVQNNSNTQKANNLFSNPGSVGLGKIGRQSESNINLSQSKSVFHQLL